MKKKTLQSQLQNPAQSIFKLLERIDGYSLSESFRLFVTACSLTLEQAPALSRRAAQTQEIRNTPEGMAVWNQAGLGKLSPASFMYFAEGFAILQAAAWNELGELTYKDVIGEVYMMTLEGARYNQDQYYTPEPICDMMAMMTAQDVESQFKERCKQAAREDPMIYALMLTAGLFGQSEDSDEGASEYLFAKLWPILKTKIEPIKVQDPCCGSGRMLLAFAKQVPRWLIDLNFVQFFGQDTNHTAVAMAQINMRLYGLTGFNHAQDNQKINAAAHPEPAGYGMAANAVSNHPTGSRVG